MLDEAMGAAVWLAGYRVVSVNINISYRNPVPLGQPFNVTALPPWYSPWRMDGSAYVDGGACSNLPLRVAVERGADEIYALNLMRPFDRQNTQPSGVFSIGARALGSLLDYTTELEIEVVRQNPHLRLHLFNLKAREVPPVWDLSHSEEMIQTGRQVTEQYLERRVISHTRSSFRAERKLT